MSLLKGKKELINPYSYSIFLFFAYVGLSRGALLLLPLRLHKNWMIYLDIAILSIFFLYAFIPLLGIN
ncbi:hypothetical protein [Myroides sp. WP-1]|uniref:hypothetical protein n=1 Tax=Myroides sp. WP-1 TaxID=2759944 RepID=UPI0015FCF857|nr:hypothetical protein [Myroides sp. WP-1]MBB1138607.1 hypothetical protein [Myroides sp. WP-1]